MKLNLRSEVRSVTSQFAVRHIAENIIQWRKRACSEGNQTIGRMGRFPPLGVLWLPRRFVARNINSMDTRLAHKIARTAFIPVDRFLLALIFLPPLLRGQAPPAKQGGCSFAVCVLYWPAFEKGDLESFFEDMP
jgi:hypothetical protein